MKRTESKKSIMAIGILTLVFFAMVGIASAADVAGNQSVGNQSSPAAPPAAPPAITTRAATTVTPLSVVGNWNLYYDWSGSGTSYSSAVMTFKSDGTFTVQGLTGRWTQGVDNGIIIWKFDSNNAVYGGNVAGKAMTGIMSLFPSSNGVWYAIKQ
ncbi:MAG: hypothetical protein WB014_01850 [Methanosarcina sp.]